MYSGQKWYTEGMFSVWPELFAYELLAIALLRVSLGYLFLLTGIRLMRATKNALTIAIHMRAIGTLYALSWLIIGGMLLFGVFTQPVALLGALLTLLPTGMHGKSVCEKHLTFLLFLLCITIIFLGPGVPAFDFPI
jgi:uncharacterized membrane protein YphA (DoxX/SURF4 family)